MKELSFAEVEAAAARITSRVREVVVAPAGRVPEGGRGDVFLALEFLHHGVHGMRPHRGICRPIRPEHQELLRLLGALVEGGPPRA